MNLKNIWRLRFQGWPWLFLPSLIGFCLALLGMTLGWFSRPDLHDFAVMIAIVLVTLVFSIIALTQIGGPLRRLNDAARSLNQGRRETRADTAARGVTGELGYQINVLGSKLMRDQDQIAALAAQSAQRLRRDSSSLQEQHQDMRRAMAEALKAAEAQSELFSTLSHELRTPLTAILGYTDLLRRSPLDDEQQAHLDTVGKSAQSMLEMINNLLDWGRIEAGRMKLNDDLLDLHQIIEDVATLLAPLAYEKNLELVHIVYEDVPRRVRGDAQRVRQIVINLLSNAIKFTQHGEVVLRVMRDRADEGRVWLNLSVSDTGPGISPEQQKRLFQAFQQTAGTRGGSGLGLTITRRLTELMGGRVDMQSTPGLGSTFGVVIPFRLAESRHLIAEPEHTPLRGLELWVMEPHPIARQSLIHQLQQWQITVRSFDTVPLLSSALHQSRPALIVLGLRAEDAQHPDYLALLQRCAGKQPPLLALVTSAASELHAELRHAGAAGTQPKSLSRHSLLSELQTLLSLSGAVPAPLAGLRALVADNNRVNRRYIATLCRELDMKVTEVADGQEALDHLHHQGADVVLLDAHMPGLDGLDCARAIRALDPDHRVRLIIASAYLEPSERAAFVHLGADGILIKPFDSAELLRMLAPRAARNLPPSKKLTTDPELLQLLREELPLQLRELENALAKRELITARDAAHQLRGTAAFYHLDMLRTVTAAMEQHLLSLDSLEQESQWRTPLQELQQALHQSLQAFEAA